MGIPLTKPFSTFAGNPYFIDLDTLIADDLLTQTEVDACAWGTEPRYVDYGKIYESRFALLEKAKARGWSRDREAVAAFEAGKCPLAAGLCPVHGAQAPLWHEVLDGVAR